MWETVEDQIMWVRRQRHSWASDNGRIVRTGHDLAGNWQYDCTSTCTSAARKPALCGGPLHILNIGCYRLQIGYSVTTDNTNKYLTMTDDRSSVITSWFNFEQTCFDYQYYYHDATINFHLNQTSKFSQTKVFTFSCSKKHKHLWHIH